MNMIKESGVPLTNSVIARREEELIMPIAHRMEALLCEPDKVIIEKYKEGNAIYLISKGECLVIVDPISDFTGQFIMTQTKKKKKKQHKEKFLRPG